MGRTPNLFISLLIVLAGLSLFGTGLGRVHLFDWDEINFAESAREMIVTGNYLDVQVNYETFWEKPPLFSWMQVASMKLFGVNEFAARFPNAIAGVLTLLVLFHIGTRLRDERFGLLWVGLYACSFLPFFYFKSGIIDPWFNLFIFLGIYCMLCYTSPEHRGSRLWQAVRSAAFLGLATLTKGPVGFLIFCLVFGVMIILDGWRIKGFRWGDVLAFLVTYVLVGGLWFILQAVTGHLTILQDFIAYQIRLFRTEDAGHGGFPLYHFVILFFGVFPASILALPMMRRGVLIGEQSQEVRHFFRWMMATLWVVLILFTIVRTKIVHYSSMCYFPITFLAAYYVDRCLDRERALRGWVTGIVVLIGVVVGVVTGAVALIDRYKDVLTPYIRDEFALKCLQADGLWRGWEWLIGVLLVVVVVLFSAYRRRPREAVSVLLAGSLAYIFMGVFFIAPHVEQYSQRAAIDFYKERVGEECYILPMFKSYAHYFYSQRMPRNSENDAAYLQRGRIDKPAYFVLKSQGEDEQNFVNDTRQPIRLYEKNGFVFYKREAH